MAAWSAETWDSKSAMEGNLVQPDLHVFPGRVTDEDDTGDFLGYRIRDQGRIALSQLHHRRSPPGHDPTIPPMLVAHFPS